MTLRPLEGIRVLDFSRTMAGPFATMLLADLGATVIKVEGTGGRAADTTRTSPPRFGWLSSAYLSLNRSKMSLAIDLGSSEAGPIIDELAKQCDIVIENLRWDNAERFGLTWDRFKRVKPSLIFCRISGFGATGPDRDAPAYDLTIQAATGALDITGEAGRPPAKMGVPVVDLQTGVSAATAVLAALERRQRDGVGSNIDVSMFDVAINMLGYMGVSYLNLGMIPTRLGSGHQTIYPYNAFATKDSHIVVAPFTQRFWRAFCSVIEREDLAEKPEYHDFASRLANREDLSGVLNGIMLQRSTSEWLERLAAAEVPAGPVNSVAEALEAQQTVARGMVAEVDVSPLGVCKILGSPFKLSTSSGQSALVEYGPPPTLGQDTEFVLRTYACLSSERVQQLKELGIVVANAEGDLRTQVGYARNDGADASDSAEEMRRTERSRRPDHKPLEGVRILDLTRMAAGPYCTLMLADLGADVVKVEAPRIGDPTRRNLPILEGTSVYFLSLNRGKRSLVVDMKTPEGRARIIELTKSANAVVENFRPGVMERLGLDYKVLVAANPQITLCSISGFGATGPMRDYTSFDLVNQAYAGYMAVTGEEGRTPVRLGWPVGDLGGGALACVAILAALHRTRRDGIGYHIDLSLHDGLISQLAYLGQTYLLSAEEPRPVGSAHLNIAPYGAYLAADGYMAVAAYTESAWHSLVEALGVEQLANDPRFSNRDVRRENRQVLDDLLAPLFRSRTIAELSAMFDERGLAYAPVANVGQALERARASGRGLVVETPTETGAMTLGVASPFVFDGARMVSTRGAPGLGQHDEDALWSAATP